MKIMKIQDLWLIVILTIILIINFIKGNTFLDKYLILIITFMCLIDLSISLIRCTLIRKKQLLKSNIIAKFKICTTPLTFISSLIILIFLIYILITTKIYCNSFFIYIIFLVYNLLSELINYICIKKQNLTITENGVIFPSGQYFTYYNMKNIEIETFKNTSAIYIDSKRSVGKLKFFILSKDLNKIKLIKEHIFNKSE